MDLKNKSLDIIKDFKTIVESCDGTRKVKHQYERGLITLFEAMQGIDEEYTKFIINKNKINEV